MFHTRRTRVRFGRFVTMTENEKVKEIVKILKERFTNFSANDAIDMAFKILDIAKKENK